MSKIRPPRNAGSSSAAKAMRQYPRSTAALNELFRGGRPPTLPDGEYMGRLLKVRIAPGITQAIAVICFLWMPWNGKAFTQSSGAGINIFARGSLPATRLLWPFYRGVTAHGQETYGAFRFSTYLGPGKSDPDRQVLKIDYDLPENPRRTIR